jgi:poly-gamma-glutamate capsule biosynthesis protein CapA/YwtB (metallophosphatase superfamily)
MRRLGAAAVLTLGLAGCAAGQAAVQRTPGPPSPAPTWTTPAPTHQARVEHRAPITIAFAGDVHFEGAIRQHLLADPRTTFGAVAPLLRAADLTIVNLETAVTMRGSAASKQFVFRAPASAFQALRAAGIDVATVANNHGMDYGPVGLQDTLSAAAASGFPIIGAGQDEAAAFTPYQVTVKGWRVAVIGATHVLDSSVAAAWTAGSDKPGLASAYRTGQLLDAVRRARAADDTVVVYLHWGTELHECPTARQEELAQQLVDAGADIVVGSHAHVVLGSGHLGKAYVDYGLGNFLFYAHGSGPTTHSSVVTLTVRGREVTSERRDPVVLENGWTRPLHGASSTRELARQDALRSCTNVT